MTNKKLKKKLEKIPDDYEIEIDHYLSFEIITKITVDHKNKKAIIKGKRMKRTYNRF